MKPTLFFLIKSVVAGLAAAFLLILIWPELAGSIGRQTAVIHSVESTIRPLTNGGTQTFSYATAVEFASPSVVNIYANKVSQEQAFRVLRDPIIGRILAKLPAGKPRLRIERSLGSGVITTEDGYILTNNHVISGALEIQVVLADGRTARARLIGADEKTDLAVLKISMEGLPFAQFALGQPLAVGDVVLAIGNPFGLEQTVTMGIVSATGRNRINPGALAGLIQTDAAINTGNSGGALINAAGQLVGINSNILNRQTGAQGIGFAIPADLAVTVLRRIIENGEDIAG